MGWIRQIPVGSVVVGDRLRALHEDRVDALVDSIRVKGLINPITVHDADDEYVLIAGRHRLEAVKRIGERSIDCIVFDLGDLVRTPDITKFQELKDPRFGEDGKALSIAKAKVHRRGS